MGITWLQEPSVNQSKALPVVPESIQVHRFGAAARFTRDGTSYNPNFLNGNDGQGLELNPKYVQGVNTNTHTTYEDRLCAARAVLALADEVEQSLCGRAALQSRRPKSATSKSYLGNDTRYEHLHEPYVEPFLGPGTYWIEGGRPNMGPLAVDSPTRGTSPARDINRASRPFVSSPRVPLFQPTVGGHLGSYLGTEFKGANDRSVEFHRTFDQRANVSDYRYSTKYQESRKEVPDVDYDTQLDRSSRIVSLACTAESRGVNAVSFMSKEPRFAVLPNTRHNDTRLARGRHDEDPASLGPGSYGAYISIGATKRPTYRLFSSPAVTAYGGTAVVHGRRQSSSSVAAYGCSGRASQQTGPTSAFTSVHRAQKYGPFTWKTDSTLTKTM